MSAATDHSAELPKNAQLKLDIMFEGLRYTPALGAAASHSFPNYAPYRFASDEPRPDGQLTARIPYMLTLENGTHVRIRGSAKSPWMIEGDQDAGYLLCHKNGTKMPCGFEPLPAWMQQSATDGTPFSKCGVSVHGDMAVVNVAPGCQYFSKKLDDSGASLRCTFCTYGAPNSRLQDLSQDLWTDALPEVTLNRMKEALSACISSGNIRHIYLVGGSLTDPQKEGLRFINLARKVQEVVRGSIPVTCGSGALPEACIATLRSENLVKNICFNLEIWSEDLFSVICPGKQKFVGYQEWLQSLETAVRYFGKGHVYSAMVAGIELEPEYGMTWQSASALAVKGAADLCARGVLPIYSLYWPVGGHERPDYLDNLKNYFTVLCAEYAAIRDRLDLKFSPDFMCNKCAYMQMECDIDYASPTLPSASQAHKDSAVHA